MPIQMTLKAAPHGVPVRLWTDTAESQAPDQLKNVARLPITHSHVAAMPRSTRRDAAGASRDGRGDRVPP